MPVTVFQRRDLHIFCYHDLSLCSLYNTQSKIISFISLPCLSAFVDSYYSPCGPLGITPGRFCYHNAKFWAEFGFAKYLIVPFWYASAAYQARLVSPWVFWLDCISPKYEPWLDQTRLICHQSVPKRYD